MLKNIYAFQHLNHLMPMKEKGLTQQYLSRRNFDSSQTRTKFGEDDCAEFEVKIDA